MQALRISLLAALPLLAVAALGSHLIQARAGAQDRPLIIGSVANIGLAPGQFLRLTAFNPHPAHPGGVHFHLLGSDGTLACQSGTVEVPPLQTAFIDVPWDSPHVDRSLGDPVTGRVQLGVVALIAPARGRSGPQPTPSVVPGSELVDASSGRTLAFIQNTQLHPVITSPPPSNGP